MKKWKNMYFFKYFIKNWVFADGGGSRDPSPLGAGLGVQFLPSIWFGDRDKGGDGCMDAGARTGYLNPPPICPLPYLLPLSKFADSAWTYLYTLQVRILHDNKACYYNTSSHNLFMFEAAGCMVYYTLKLSLTSNIS